jgi:superfamily II DNA or RNA helicase
MDLLDLINRKGDPFNGIDFINIELKDSINKNLLPYQIMHVYKLVFAIKNNQASIDGSDTGTGKTYCAIAACKQLGLQPFIICQISGMTIWNNVCKKFGVKPISIVNYETIKKCKMYLYENDNITSKRVQCPYLNIDEINDTFVWNLPLDTIVIFDEAHLCKNKESINGRLLSSLQIYSNTRLLKAKLQTKILLLSATIIDKIEDLTLIGWILGLYEDLKRAKQWIDYVINISTSKNKLQLSNSPRSGEAGVRLPSNNGPKQSSSNDNELSNNNNTKRLNSIKQSNNNNTNLSQKLASHDCDEPSQCFPEAGKMSLISAEANSSNYIAEQLFPAKGSRMKICELGEMFPKNQISAECYHLEQEYIKKIDTEFDNIKKNNSVLKKIIESRIKIEFYKIPILVELTKNYIEMNYSVVIFVNFKKTIALLKELLHTGCVIDGDQDIKTREANIKLFQTNKRNIIICNIKAGGQSISLHDTHGGFPRVSLICPSFSSIELIQCLGRICRAGSKSPALQRIIFTNSKVEKLICDNMNKKIKFLNKLKDNDLFNDPLNIKVKKNK